MSVAWRNFINAKYGEKARTKVNRYGPANSVYYRELMLWYRNK
jgi:hypothetical protein